VPRSDLRFFGDVSQVPPTVLLTVGFGSVKRQKDYVLEPWLVTVVKREGKWMERSTIFDGKITIFNGYITIFNGYITIFNGQITIFNGKIHYFNWAIFIHFQQLC